LLRPTKRQEAALGACLEDTRQLYNAALEERRDVTQAEFRCLACGHQAHADVNAAKNILRAGLVLREA
jgi:hypothetical protein